MPRNRFGFSANHFTILGVTAMLALTSGTVWSVSAYTNVALQDPVNGRKAAIDATRQTLVKDTRASTDIIQSNFVNFWRTVGSTCVAVATPPAGKSMVMKTLAANTFQVTSPGSGKYIYIYRGTGCDTPVVSLNPRGVGVESISLEPGIVVPDGQKLWAYAATDIITEIYGNGYLIPSAWGPPSVPLSATEPANAHHQAKNTLGNGG